MTAVVQFFIPSSGAADSVLFPKEHGPERGYHASLVAGREFADFELSVRLRRLAGITHYGLVFRYVDESNLYRLVLRTDQRDFRVEKVINGESDYATTRYVAFPSQENRWYEVRLSAVGPAVKVWIDGQLLYESDAFSELTAGQVGVTVYDAALAEFDDFAVRSPDGARIEFADDFDDGDCQGWEAVGLPGVKGVWDVQEKVERQPPETDFEVLSGFQVCPPGGKNRTMFEFPSLVRLQDSRLFTIFIEENQHGTPPWAAMPSSGRLWCAWSADLGRTWTPPRPFLDTPVDDRHSYVTQLPDGRLLATFWVQLVAFGSPGLLNYTTVSEDGGVTWSDPVRWRSPNGTWGTGKERDVFGSSSVTVPAQLHPDGRLYLAVHTTGHDGRPPCEAGLLWSRDGGRTWGDYVTVAFDPERRISFVEPAILRLASGKWIAVMRTEIPITPGTTHPYRLGPTMWCTSPDGREWIPFQEMPLDFTKQGSTAPFLLQTTTGVVVFAVNTGTAFSYDDGETWVPQDLRCGYYPVLAELAPGTLASLACGMGGQIFRLTKTPQTPPLPPFGRGGWEGLSPTPVPTFPAPAPLPVPKMDAVAVRAVSGTPRVVRVRGALPPGRSPLVAPDEWPLLALFGAETDAGPAVAAVLSDGARTAWTEPFLAARTEGPVEGLGLGAARDGTLLATFCVQPPDGPARSYAARSADHGLSWTPATEIRAETSPVEATADAVSMGDRQWLLPATVRTAAGEPVAVVLQSNDDGATWQRVSEIAPGLIEPALTVARDGRWIALACPEDRSRLTPHASRGSEIFQCLSTDHGATWTEPSPTGLHGARPAVVELLETFFLAAVEGDDGLLTGGLGWDELACWLPSRIACGHLVRIGGRKFIGRGCGVDLAGEYNRLAQVPLDPAEIAAAEAMERERIDATAEFFRFDGAWERVEDAQGVRFVSKELATATLRFRGTGVFLLHGRRPDGHLLQVTLDGEEYPPVETRGTDEFPVRTCLAVGLPPGDHELSLTPLLRWQSGSMVIGGVEVVRKPP